jgi:plastocyanin
MERASSAVVGGLVAGLLAGCGSGGYGPTNLQTAPPGPSRPPAASGGRPAKIVIMRGLAFRPGTITTTVGRGVEWINRDDVRHNVTAADGATIASPDVGPGGRFVYVPAAVGAVRYYCTIHPSTMSGLLIVTAG